MDKNELIKQKETELRCYQDQARKATREAGEAVREADRLQKELQELREEETK